MMMMTMLFVIDFLLFFQEKIPKHPLAKPKPQPNPTNRKPRTRPRNRKTSQKRVAKRAGRDQKSVERFYALDIK